MDETITLCTNITALRSGHAVSGLNAAGPVTGFEINPYTSVRMSFTSSKYFFGCCYCIYTT